MEKFRYQLKNNNQMLSGSSPSSVGNPDKEGMKILRREDFPKR